MNKKIKILATMVLMLCLVTGVSAFSMDVNGGMDPSTYQDELEDGVQCVADDGNFTVVITDANASTDFIVTFNGIMLTTTSISPWAGDTNGSYGTGIYDDNVMTSNDSDGTSAMTLNIAVPDTEGYSQLCVYDSNSVASIACEWVGIKPDSTYTGYTITNSDGNGFCKTTNYATFAGTITDSADYGQIETVFGNTYNLSGDIDFDSTITWTNANKIEVTTAALVNQTTKLTFLKPELHSSKFEVRRNDSACSICDGITSSNGTVYFTTTGFSVYEVKDLAAGDVGAGGTIFQPASIIAGGDIVGAVGGINNLALIVIIGIVAVILIGAKYKK